MLLRQRLSNLAGKIQNKWLRMKIYQLAGYRWGKSVIEPENHFIGFVDISTGAYLNRGGTL